ncbi:hypothetical protein HM1_1623 [Heliomicrobium modesticaldum Ice1]|uniref:Uncharacterized protein n=1 Tax=Heliobacterium modesticaldum (strain ATCC 51547 / Ice1) TaxID=498761 RepID=B0TDF2_HELMI|nr:hypothetical protein [Heliomicrobium modesticaldum]ABZ84193.1 hypothetical protein HM1_1623 [Heliomicrobium modesticaldum Ice1]
MVGTTMEGPNKSKTREKLEMLLDALQCDGRDVGPQDVLGGLTIYCMENKPYCGECSESDCLVGFARQAAAYGLEKGDPRAVYPHRLPMQDRKHFRDLPMAKALLVLVLYTCAQCDVKCHRETCCVNLEAHALEMAIYRRVARYAQGAVGLIIRQLDDMSLVDAMKMLQERSVR